MDDLTPELRARVAAAWTDAALEVHESIACQAHLTLELLALCAPQSLVEDAQAAGLDEVRRARACFRIASRYAGESVKPAALRLDASTLETRPAGLLGEALNMYCVEETLAITTHEVARSRTPDARIRDALTESAACCTRQAQLGWRISAWLLDANPDLAEVAQIVLNTAIRAVGDEPTPATDPDDQILALHGVLSGARRHAARMQALDTMVRPAAAQLLASIR